LRELRSIDRNCPERAATYVRWRRVATVVGGALVVAACVLGARDRVRPESCVLIAMQRGLALGFGFTFSISWPQVQVLGRYATLRDEDVQRRLQELGDACACAAACGGDASGPPRRRSLPRAGAVAEDRRVRLDVPPGPERRTRDLPRVAPRCLWCGSDAAPVEVHGHVQCAACKVNVDPCCGGETACRTADADADADADGDPQG